MKNESISEALFRRLDAARGQHSRIAAEAGISQASISRYHLRKASPSLHNAEALMAWFDADDARKQAARKRGAGKSALRLAHTERVRVESAAAPAVAQ